jgi:hypothetical protein
MYKWSLLKVREGKYKRKHGGAQVEFGVRTCFSSPGAFKTYANLWGGKNQEIAIQKSMSGEGHRQFPGQVREASEPEGG